MKPPTPKHPLVVLDLNVLQDEAIRAFRPLRGWTLVIPDIVIAEALEKKDPANTLEKILAFAGDQKCEVWLGRDRDLLFHAPGYRVQLSDLVWPMKWQRAAHSSSDLERRALQLKSHDELIRHGEATKWFSELTGSYREYFESHCRAERDQLNSVDWLRQQVQHPSLVAKPTIKFLKVVEHSNLPLKARQRRKRGFPCPSESDLTRFPDVLPFARWMRLIAWYAFQRTRLSPGSNKDESFQNNFEDSFYALLASYTGHLLSNDAGVRTAAAMIAPGIRLWQWNGNTKRIESAT